MNFLLITNAPDIARFAVENGVDQIMVDLEILGKAERQGHLDTVMNSHDFDDVRRVRGAVPPGRLVVRTNPLNAGSGREVDAIIAAGADRLMLPYFHTPQEVSEFVRLVAGRAGVILLAETRGAMESLPECAAIAGVEQVHIGLNDLSLALGKRFMFELLVDGTVERMARILREAGRPFGIGGIARIGEGLLPAERILAEHARFGSTGAILSRTFHRQARSVDAIRQQMDFGQEILLLREAYAKAFLLDEAARRANTDIVSRAAAQISADLPDRAARRP